MTEPLWQPSENDTLNSRMSAFMRFVAARTAPLATYDDLFRYSLDDAQGFWSALWDFCGVRGEKGAPPYLLDGKQMPGAQFFPNARLNFAENLLRRHDETPAIIFWGENQHRRTVTWSRLADDAARFATFLSESGVVAGERVAAIMPNIPETVAAMLGAAAIGAVWSSCSPDFGPKGVLDRFGQIEPKVLVVVDGYFYNGKLHRVGEKVREIVAQIPSVERVVVVHYGGDPDETIGALDAGVGWNEVMAAGEASPEQFVPLSFAHPLYILFSSGTTGAPKCIVHSAGGTLLQHLKEQALHCDLRRGERLFFFTTCGWMMWNWLVSGLACEATLMLYDGSPFHPDANVLFDFAEAEGTNILGTSAKFIDALNKAGRRPRDTHDLSKIRLMISTGSVLAAEGFDYVYEAIKPDIHLASVSGGTDIISCFVIGNPLKPVWRGEIQGPGLAMATDIFDAEGRHLANGKGELVCTQPFPSMPVGFWNDPDGQKYKAAYFSRFENIWHHGDFAEWTDHGGFIIHGRSDATLNPGGVRIGTAEIYRQVEQMEEVVESIVIGQEWENDVRIVLFVVLKDGLELDDSLRNRVKSQVRTGASPRHVPARIVQVTDIPRTKSGKITELAVRDIVHGRPVVNREALANPEALDLYVDLGELMS